jgi:PAS domain S-box-containing protein
MASMLLRLRQLRRPGLLWQALGLLGYSLWVIATPPTLLRDLIAMFGSVAAKAAATFALLVASGRLAETPEQRSWRTLGVGLALGTLAAGIEVLIRISTGGLPGLPSVSDWLGMAGALAALTAIVAYPPRISERFSRVREVLDVAILSLAVGALAWLVFIRATLAVGIGDPVEVLWSAVGPGLDLILVGLLVRRVLRSEARGEATLFGLLSSGFLLLAAADLGNGYRRLLGDPSTGGLVELGWMAAGLLVVAAATRLGVPRPAARESRPGFTRVVSRLEALLPIAFTYAVVGTVIADWWLSKQVDWFMVTAAAALSLLLMARQGVIIGQVEMRQYAALVNSSADLSFISDKEGKLLLANPALRAALGWSESVPLDASLLDILVSAKSSSEILGFALEQGWSGEVGLQRRTGLGPPFPVYLSLRPIQDERRNELLLAGTAHDLTLIKRRESELERALTEIAAARTDLQQLNAELERKVQARTRQLEQTVSDLARLNDELKELDQLKSEFVALVSHELRAPLTNIRSGIELVLEREPTLVTSVEESLRLVQQETERLAGFVGTILDLSALEAGRFPLELRPLDLVEVAEQVAAQFPDLTRMRREFPPELPRILADEAGLKSILYHLLDNAMKYAPEGELSLAAAVENGKIRVSLSDSGPGVPSEDRERIFEMFHRLDSRDEREVYGHGLGLPMVRRLVEAMGGTILVKPSLSDGAQLVFWLPVAVE